MFRDGRSSPHKVTKGRRVSKAEIPRYLPRLLTGASCVRIEVMESADMTGIQFVTDDKGRRTAVLIDLKKHGALWEDFWDGLVSESRRKEKSIPYQEYRANRIYKQRSLHRG
jgi:hypothetical protein